MAEEKESHQKGDNVVRSRRKAWANAARCGGGKWSGAPYAGEKLTARVYSAIFAPKTSWGAGPATVLHLERFLCSGLQLAASYDETGIRAPCVKYTPKSGNRNKENYGTIRVFVFYFF